MTSEYIDVAATLRNIHKAIADFQGHDTEHVRLMKVGEEFGEAVQAYIGLTGYNKRKGQTHFDLDVAKELCDIVITAFVSLHDWTDFPIDFFGKHLETVAKRVETVGS